MTDEVREYAERKIWESGVRRVPGHYPHFKTKQDVDRFTGLEERMFWDAFGEDDVTEISRVDAQKYKDLLWRLKKNEDNVPREVLRTKHKAAYDSLRQELKEMTKAIIHELVYGSLYITRPDEKRIIQAINQAIVESGIYKAINQAIYQDKCYGNVISSVMRLRKIVQEATEKECQDG